MIKSLIKLSFLLLVLSMAGCSTSRGNTERIVENLKCDQEIWINIDETRPTDYLSLYNTAPSRPLTPKEFAELKADFIEVVNEINSITDVEIKLVDQLGFADENIAKANLRIATVIGKKDYYKVNSDIELKYQMLNGRYESFATNLGSKNSFSTRVLPLYAMKVAVRDLVVAMCNHN